MKIKKIFAALRWNSLALWGFHALALAGIILALTGIIHLTWKDSVFILVLYRGRMFFISAGYHRYFSHRSFQLRAKRFSQFILGFLAVTSIQRGPIWWSKTHRNHHRYSDQPKDIHSPKQRGFWYAHMGWVFADKDEPDAVSEFEKYPALRWLDKWHWIPGTLLGLLCFVFAGINGLFDFFLSTTLLWHGTWTVNSITHGAGLLLEKTKGFRNRHPWLRRAVALLAYRPHETTDTSANVPLLDYTGITEGEGGGHNDHHLHPSYVRQGSHWWELDTTFIIIWLVQFIGVTKKLRMAGTK